MYAIRSYYEIASCMYVYDFYWEIQLFYCIIINTNIKNDLKTFTETVNKANELDEIITKYSEKRIVDRIPKINLAIS